MNKIVVTGAAGFIGSNLIQGLNARGIDDIIAVDDLSVGDKFRNLADLRIADYVDMDDFYALYGAGHYGDVEAVFHEGACSDTMEQDGKYMMDNNFTLSCELFQACMSQGTRLLYASSAATYGGSSTFKEEPAYEKPLNVYGYSKLLFDQKMRRELGTHFEKHLTKWWALGTSMCMALENNTRAAWPAWRITSFTSSWLKTMSSSLASTAAMPMVNNCATLCM